MPAPETTPPDRLPPPGVTVAFLVPGMLAAVVATGLRPPGLRRVFYSGAPISLTALSEAMAALQCDFIQIYGLTEATGAFAQLPSHEHDPNGPLAHLLLSAGRPYPWVEVCAMSAATGRAVPAGQVGEIWTRSEQNMVGYWNDGEQSARALTPDGWLRTGDLGRIDEEGRIFLVDREKDLIISGGENVYPVEVSRVGHPTEDTLEPEVTVCTVERVSGPEAAPVRRPSLARLLGDGSIRLGRPDGNGAGRGHRLPAGRARGHAGHTGSWTARRWQARARRLPWTGGWSTPP